MSFLDQLQQSTGLLTNQVKNTQPFSTYSPTASDYVMGIAQNQFTGNQFQMPNLALQPGQNIPVFGGTYSSSPYVPSSFKGAFDSSEMTQPRINPLVVADPFFARGGAGQERDMASTQSGLERIGGMNLKIDPVSGKVEVLDPNSLASNLLTDYSAIQKFTPAGMISGLLGGNAYDSQLDRIRSQYGDAVADAIDAAVTSGIPPESISGLLSGGLRPGTKVKIGNTPGFINSQGNFQGGTLIGDLDINKPVRPSGQSADIPGGPGAEQLKSGGGTGGKSSPSSSKDKTGGFGKAGGMGEGGANYCFDPNTLIQMIDGSEKKIKDMKLGDQTKGGEVTGVFQFKASDEIHDYKGVTVAGSHYVKEDGNFIMVQDSPISVKIDKIPVVYSLDTSDRRIWINDIEFADYNGDGIAKGFLHNAGIDLSEFNKEVLRQVENKLI